MAGRKYICKDCGFTAWRSYTAPCLNCGSENFFPSGYTDDKRKECPECKKLFTPDCSARKTCSPECKEARDKRIDRERARKSPKYGNCIYCNGVFYKVRGNHIVCSNKECQDKKNENKRKNAGSQSLLGPEHPEMPMRKCHTCGKPTYDYWCDKCRGYYRAYNGVTGLSGTSELFAGALIDDGRV